MFEWIMNGGALGGRSRRWIELPNSALTIGSYYTAMGAVAPNGTYYLAGGGTSTGSAVFRKLEGGVWVPLANMPDSRVNVAVAVLDDYVYVCGGRSKHGSSGALSTSTFWRYSILENTWAELSSSPIAVVGYSLIPYGGELYLRAGIYLYKYTPVLGSWSTLPTAPVNHQYVMSALVGDYIYSHGGGGSAVHHQFTRYHIPTSTWEVLPVGPPARRYSTLVSDGTDVYLQGGYKPSTPYHLSDTWKFTTSTLSWEDLTSEVGALQASANSGFYFNGHYYVVGVATSPTNRVFRLALD